MSKNNIGLVAFCKVALAAGTGYVYGTFGQVCTKTLLDQKAVQYPANNLAGEPMRTVGNKWIGGRVTDCIGLIKYYLMSTQYGAEPVYIQKFDCLNANGLFAAAKEKGLIDSIPEIPGLLLHMNGHVGVYIGDGYAIEAAGTAKGVIKTKVAGRGWDHWYKCIWFDYVSAAPVPTTASAGTTVSDTNGNFNVNHGTTYQFKLTCSGTGVPTIVPGSANFKYISTASSGKVHLIKFTAVGAVGSATGFYINGSKTATAIAHIL